MNCTIWLFEYRCRQRICDCEACVSQPDHFLLKGGYFRNGFTRRRGHKHAYTQPFHHLPSPPAPVQLITISTNPNQKKKKTKDRKRMEVEGGMLSSRNAIFCLQPKGGKRECHRKCQGALTPSLLPGCCQPPRAMMEGQTHTSFKNLPASLAFVAARHIFIDDSVNVHDRHKSTSCISEGFLWIRKDSCCRNFFQMMFWGISALLDRIRCREVVFVAFMRQFQASCTKLLIRSHTVVIVYVGFM